MTEPNLPSNPSCSKHLKVGSLDSNSDLDNMQLTLRMMYQLAQHKKLKHRITQHVHTMYSKPDVHYIPRTLYTHSQLAYKKVFNKWEDVLCSSCIHGKSGEGRLLAYSRRLLDTSLPSFLTIFITCEVNNHNGCCDFLKEWQI